MCVIAGEIALTPQRRRAMFEEDPGHYAQAEQSGEGSSGETQTETVGEAVSKHVGQITTVARALERCAEELHQLAGPCRHCESLEAKVGLLRTWLAHAIVDGLLPAEVEQVLREDPAFAAGEYASARREQAATDDYWAEVADAYETGDDEELHELTGGAR